MKKFDNITIVGSNHQICEDHSIGNYDVINSLSLPHLIISDGCSSSNQTEYGSKILARLADVVFWQLFPSPIDGSFRLPKEVNINGYIDEIIRRAQITLNSLSLPTTALDATLMVLFHTYLPDKFKDCYLDYKDLFVVMVFGDGVVFWRYKDNPRIHYTKIDCTHNAPPYLSYRLDEQRMDLYLEKSASDYLNITEYAPEANPSTSVSPLTGTDYWFDTFPMDQIEMIGIASDGVEQIRSRETGEYLPMIQVLEDFTAFKGTNGEFVRRRVKRALSDYTQNKFYPTDDISVAVMLNEDR